MQWIENFDALGRPVTAGECRAGNLLCLARKQAGIEEGPEPGNEEHHFGRDEHDHAIAQVQGNDAGVVPFLALPDGIRPPAEHGVENDGQADEEQPWLCQVMPKERQFPAAVVAHVSDAADSHDKSTHRA